MTYDGKYFINPGTGTGAYSSLSPTSDASFILMAIQGDDVSAFVYKMKGEQMSISRIDFTKNGDMVQEEKEEPEADE